VRPTFRLTAHVGLTRAWKRGEPLAHHFDRIRAWPATFRLTVHSQSMQGWDGRVLLWVGALDDLSAGHLGSRRGYGCDDLAGGTDGDRVWLTCDCGAGIAHPIKPTKLDQPGDQR